MQFELDQATEVLRQTPAVLNALLRGKSPVWLNCKTTPESFSPLDVVGHLTHADKTNWIPRARMILGGNEAAAFEPFDRFAFQPMLAGRTAESLLDEFAESRRQSLQTLSKLGVEERHLEMTGLHPEFGAVKLSNLLATWVVHDFGHISQIVRIMSNEYREAVGAWRAYLTVLQ